MDPVQGQSGVVPWKGPADEDRVINISTGTFYSDGSGDNCSETSDAPERPGTPMPQESSLNLRRTTSPRTIGGPPPSPVTEMKVYGVAQERFELVRFLLAVASGLCICGAIIGVVGNINMITVVALMIIAHYCAKPATEEEPCPWDASWVERAALPRLSNLLEGLELHTKARALRSLKRALEILPAISLVPSNPTFIFYANEVGGHRGVSCYFSNSDTPNIESFDSKSIGNFSISILHEERALLDPEIKQEAALCSGRVFLKPEINRETGEVTVLVQAILSGVLGGSWKHSYFVVTNTAAQESYHIEKIVFDSRKDTIEIWGKEAASSGSSSPGSGESWTAVSASPAMRELLTSGSTISGQSEERPESKALGKFSFDVVRATLARFLREQSY